MNSDIPTTMVLGSDETITREGLRSLFREASKVAIVGEADTIMSTPKKVRDLVPDVALLDITVPGRAHGLRAAAEIAQQSSEARVVVLTNNSDLPYVRSMLACGVSAYLLKSSGASQLFAAVRNVTRGDKIIDPTLASNLAWRTHGRRTAHSRPTFSRRELQVLKALVRGYTNAQSSHLLKVSTKTIETYRLRLYRKLNVRSRAELVEYALAHRLLTETE